MDSIVFACQCGAKLTTLPGTTGQKTKCPSCGRVLIVPAAGVGCEDGSKSLLYVALAAGVIVVLVVAAVLLSGPSSPPAEVPPAQERMAAAASEKADAPAPEPQPEVVARPARLPAGGTSPGWFVLQFSDHRGVRMPEDGPRTMARALMSMIDDAAERIDFAADDIWSIPGLSRTLQDAGRRGLRIRGLLHPELQWQCVSRRGTELKFKHGPKGVFVLDGSAVWLSSLPVRRRSLGAEYDAGYSLLIRDDAIAGAFAQGFQRMWAGGAPATEPPFIHRMDDGTKVELASHYSDSIADRLLAHPIALARDRVRVTATALEVVPVVRALIDAHKRGVSVRIIADAAGMTGTPSLSPDLRAAGLPVKVESWGGRLLMNMVSVDGRVVTLSSLPLLPIGESAARATILQIANQPLTAAFDAHFDRLWGSVSDRWLTANPAPEGPDSPGSLSDLLDNDSDNLTDEGAPEELNTVSDDPGAINVYFNKSALARYALPNNKANQHVNLERRLLKRLAEAERTIDMACYELNLERIVNALIGKAAAGVRVRLVVDAKDPEPDDVGRTTRYRRMRLAAEKLLRGRDGRIGTEDDVHVFSESALLAVESTPERVRAGLPKEPTGLERERIKVGRGYKSGYLLPYGEKKKGAGFFSPAVQMHHKFVVVDGRWVWTGSWNMTVTGLYGTEEHSASGLLGGSSQHVVEIHSAELAAVYTREFEEMWGGSGATPDPAKSNFAGRKADDTQHLLTVGGIPVECYFSPSDQALKHVCDYVRGSADQNVYFLIFAFSDQTLTDVLKEKWEGSKLAGQGQRTGFELRGVFDRLFWNQWWSASVDMTGRRGKRQSEQNPNVYWAVRPPIFPGGEDRKLHMKTMLVDAGTDSDPAVITGSMNWSQNGDEVNDENTLIIYNARIVNLFEQEFWARYWQAGGWLRPVD